MDRGACYGVCKQWKLWLTVNTLDATPLLRCPESSEILRICNRLRALKMPWDSSTESYMSTILSKRALIPHSSEKERIEDTLESLTAHLEHLYVRSVITPMTNIGTLDTTRVMERMTQAKLSRFHTTGAASVQQASSLENLLHPQQSMRNAQMLIYLDPSKVDVTSCTAVMSHLRGRVISTKVVSFLNTPPSIMTNKVMDEMPALLRLRLYQDNPDALYAKSVNGIELSIDNDALVWHDCSVEDLVRRMAPNHPDIHLLPWSDLLFTCC